MVLASGTHMPTTSLRPFRAAGIALTLVFVANVAACADGSNPTKELANSLGIGPKTAPSPDFVARSRPQSLDYMPIGVGAGERPTKARTAEEIKAAEAEMDALRARNEAAGAAAARLGGTPEPAPVNVQAKKPAPNKTP
jgi:hypothetical protein